MDRRAALTVLGLDDAADLDGLKQRFRILARSRHPDLGGDPADFQALHAAYELLQRELSSRPEPNGPRVARGRPSRGDLGDTATDLDRLALSEAAEVIVANVMAEGVVRRVSRAPGAWTNRLAASLSTGSTSSLDVALPPVPRGPDAPEGSMSRRGRVELTARGRAARRAVARLDVAGIAGPTWARRRGDAIVVVEADIGAADVATTARRTVAAAVLLLDALRWPLEQWATEQDAG